MGNKTRSKFGWARPEEDGDFIFSLAVEDILKIINLSSQKAHKGLVC